MVEDEPKNKRRITSQRDPSGRWNTGDFDDGPTPPPVDVERRGRLTEIDVQVTTLSHVISGIGRRVDHLERNDQEMALTMHKLSTDSAVSAIKLDAIKVGVDEIKSQQSKGGDRTRNTVQLLIAALGVLVAIAAILTRF